MYSLAVQNQGLWLLSGIESGVINLQSIRHDEGKRITSLKKHTSAVSVLKLADDERSVLSGSWDKTIVDWDLNTGVPIRTFDGSGGQISALEIRPISSLPVPETLGESQLGSSTFFDDHNQGLRGGQEDDTDLFSGDALGASRLDSGIANTGASPSGSLFGDDDHASLFGDANDDDNPSATAPTFGGDDFDDEFSRAITGLNQTDDATG